MNREEKKQYMKVWYQKNKGRVLKKQQKIRDDAKIVSPLEKKIVELERQIKKMKCCQNCKNLLSLAYGEFSCDLYGECKHCSKWELKEND